MAPKRNRDQSDRDREELRRIANRGILRNNIARTIQTLNEDDTDPFGLPNAWRPNQAFAPAGNPVAIVPAPNAPIAGAFAPNAPAVNFAQPANPQPVAVAPQFQDAVIPNMEVVSNAPQEDEGEEEMEGIDEDEPTPQEPFDEIENMDLSEFDDFGTGRLFGNGVSGRRRMNYRRRMYY